MARCEGVEGVRGIVDDGEGWREDAIYVRSCIVVSRMDKLQFPRGVIWNAQTSSELWESLECHGKAGA
jgi:hypothetical protein